MSSFYDHQSEYIGEHSPIRIEFVETQQHVDELLPALYDMVTDGLITVQDLTAIKAVATDARARPAPLENSKRIVTVSALEGYVETTELHPPHLFQSDLPIVITIVERPEEAEQTLPVLQSMMNSGPVAVTDVEATMVSNGKCTALP